MSENIQEPQQIREALRSAREEGHFQGKIFASLESIEKSIDEIKKCTIQQDLQLDGKVSIADFKETVKDVKNLQRFVNMGLGALGIIQLLILALK